MFLSINKRPIVVISVALIFSVVLNIGIVKESHAQGAEERRAAKEAFKNSDAYRAAKDRAKQSARAKSSLINILNVMRQPNCVRCHDLSGLPSTWNSLNENEIFSRIRTVIPDHPEDPVVSTCAACHSRDVLKIETNIELSNINFLDIDWQAPPQGQEFTGKLDQELCEALKQLTTIGQHATQDHLKRDPLIVWAVSGGGLPQNRGPRDDREGAVEGGMSDWVRWIDDWQTGLPRSANQPARPFPCPNDIFNFVAPAG